MNLKNASKWGDPSRGGRDKTFKTVWWTTPRFAAVVGYSAIYIVPFILELCDSAVRGLSRGNLLDSSVFHITVYERNKKS